MAGQLIRFFVFALCAGVLAAAGSSAASVGEPYRVWIVPGGAEVYSGPDETYYATQALPAGHECQVFEQLPGGWLAIRPPQGSFSLVSEAAIEPADEGVVRVVRETASSRVGSRLTSKHDAMHVRLKRGELLQLAGDADLSETWVKIEPPAGEFRYVRAGDASRVEVAPAESTAAADLQTIELGSRPTVASTSAASTHEPAEAEATPIVAAIDLDQLMPPTQQDSSQQANPQQDSEWVKQQGEAAPTPGEIQTVRYDDLPPSVTPSAVPGQFVAPNLLDSTAGQAITPPTVAPAANAAPLATPLATSAPAGSPVPQQTPAVVDNASQASPGWQASSTPITPIVNTTTPLPEVTAGTASAVAVPPQSPKAAGQSPRAVAPQTAFDAQLDQIEVQVSRRVAGPMNLWRFEDLERSAAQLLSIATTPDQARTVNELASRLTRLGELGRRQRAGGATAAGTIATTSPTTPSAGGTRDPALSQYDAVGVLRPVVSSRGNAPPYALVDESGQVVTFVTPAPSLNLQPHLGKRIGVSGARGFLPEYSRRNIQTASVAPLGDTLVR